MSAQTSGPPELANALINGTNTYNDGGYKYNTVSTSCSYFCNAHSSNTEPRPLAQARPIVFV